MFQRLKFLTLGIVLAWPAAAYSLDIIGYNSTINDRFSSGYPSSPTPNTDPSFVGAGYDFSGVGWNTSNSTQSFVMISPEYFVYATHYPPSSSISFYSPNQSAVVNYAVDTAASITFTYPYALGGMNLKTDLSIGKLQTPLSPSDGITYYPILDLAADSDYIGLNLLVYGFSARIGTGMIEDTGAWNLYDDNLTPFNASDDVLNTPTTFDNISDTYGMSFTQSATGNALAQGGDSGGPSFVVWNGSLALVGIHSAIDNQTTYDTFIPAYLQTMEDEGVAFSTVPESTSLLLFVASVGTLALLRRRVRA